MRRHAGTWVAFLVVAAGALVLTLPGTLASVVLSQDAVSYVATPWIWLHGRGWVDPIVYSNYLPELRPPAPALAIRAPLVSLLFALPLALGAGIRGLALAHAAWAALVGASGVWVARSRLSLPASFAFGAALAWSYAWVLQSRRLLTEISACGVVLLVLALARGFTTSHLRALVLGVVLWLGWLTRPNLAMLLPALLCAAILELGFAAALRARPLWTLVLSCAALQQLTSLASSALTGFTPYAHYGVMLELVDMRRVSDYQRETVGVVAFVETHAEEIGRILRWNLRQYYKYVFAELTYLHVGWLALPALVHALTRRGPGSLERRVAGCSALLLTGVVLVVWGGFDAARYPLPGAVCLWFAVCALLDDARRWLVERLPAARLRPVLHTLPALAVIALWAPENLPGWARSTSAQWRSYREHGTELRFSSRRSLEEPIRALCPRLDPDAVVASVQPWELYLWCGNAGLALPLDIDSVASAERYLEDRRPGYVVIDRRLELRPFAASLRLARVASAEPLTLYEVIDAAPASRPWRAPPPLATAGG